MPLYPVLETPKFGGLPQTFCYNAWSTIIMPPISGRSPHGDKIFVDRETFRKVFFLLLSSLDELNYARHREVFLDCLDTFLTESSFLDDDQCFQGSLLLDAYYEYVPAALASVRSNLEQAVELMRVEHD